MKVKPSAIKETIFSHPEFTGYSEQLALVFTNWKNEVYTTLSNINESTAPKNFIFEISEQLIKNYTKKPLIDTYDMYQHIMDYWNETLKDDVYLVVEDGWKANVRRIVETNKKTGKQIDKGWICDLLPKQLIIDAYFSKEQQAILELEATIENIQTELTTYEEEHCGEEGLLEEAANDTGKITKTTLTKRLKEVKGDASEKDAYKLMLAIEKLFTKNVEVKKQLKVKLAELETTTLKKYSELNEAEVKTLVIDAKWLTTLNTNIQTEIDAISQRLTSRVKELAERYENTLTQLETTTKAEEDKVKLHLQKMGLQWN